MGHIKLLSRLQPAEFPYCCVFLRDQQLCIGVFGPGKVCGDGAHQAAGQEETDGVQQTLDGPGKKALTGFSLCVHFQRKSQITASSPCLCVVPPLYKNNCGVTGGCQDRLLVEPRAVETAGLDREEERTLLSEKAPPSGWRRGGKLTEKQEVWLESSRFDWKILLSGAFRCADRRRGRNPNTTSAINGAAHCVLSSLSLAAVVHSGYLRLLTYLSQA